MGSDWLYAGMAGVIGSLVLWAIALFRSRPGDEPQEPAGEGEPPPGSDTAWRLGALAEAVRRRRVPPSLSERLVRVGGMTGGTVVNERSSVTGHVRWMREGLPYYYYETSMENGWWGFLAMRLGVQRLPTLQVVQRRGATPFPPLPVTYAEPSGVPRFDARFEVRLPAGDLRAGGFPLSPDTCAQFVLLDRILPLPPFLSVEAVRCRVALQGFLLQAPDPERVLEEACRLIERVVRQQAIQVEHEALAGVDVMTVREDAAALCRVCGEEIAGERIVCARCGTPHHADCWEYTGGCSVFACLSRDRR